MGAANAQSRMGGGLNAQSLVSLKPTQITRLPANSITPKNNMTSSLGRKNDHL